MAEPAPVTNPESEDVYPHLLRAVEDTPWLRDKLAERVAFGREKYKVVLQTHNGRNAANDAREELYDFLFYWTQMYLESPHISEWKWLAGVDRVVGLLLSLEGLDGRPS